VTNLCKLCKTSFIGYGDLCDDCAKAKRDSNIKCFGCGGVYQGKACSCGRGLDIVQTRSIYQKAFNNQQKATSCEIAKGLLFLKNNVPSLFDLAVKAIEKSNPLLLNEAREFYKNNLRSRINEK
jgi:hypothetical protein